MSERCPNCGEVHTIEESKSRVKSGVCVIDTTMDVFTKVSKRKIKIMVWLWPDLLRVLGALTEFWKHS